MVSRQSKGWIGIMSNKLSPGRNKCSVGSCTAHAVICFTDLQKAIAYALPSLAVNRRFCDHLSTGVLTSPECTVKSRPQKRESSLRRNRKAFVTAANKKRWASQARRFHTDVNMQEYRWGSCLRASWGRWGRQTLTRAWDSVHTRRRPEG